MMEERNILAPLHQVEKLAIQATPQSIQSFKEAFEGELPKAVYPEIRAITADKSTRNKTYYPLENLLPNEDGTRGIITYLYPYPKPILYQHDADSNKAEVFGRAKYVAMAQENGVNFVSLIPEITDPYAIQKVMDGRFLTVSIGSETDWVKCSICGCNRHEDYCDHTRGLSYKLKDGNISECVWHMGPMVFEELSFVISPSDTDARVLRVHTDIKKVPLLKAEAMDLRPHYLESKKKSWNFAVRESARILESVNATLEDVEPEEDDEDEIVTLGSLYDLEEDDPDFNSPADEYDAESGEAKLSAAQRKALPASSFCGPGRSFPANDACLIGATGIPLMDGRVVRIDEIQDLLAAGEDVIVYSYDIDNVSIKPGKVVWAGLTLQEAETLEVELDNDIIICTGNHPFLTKFGEYFAAEDLPIGEEILALDSEDFGGDNLTTHTVVDVRPGPTAPVYDIEVEEYHNFALDAGVFVHNSHARVGLSMLSRSKAPNKDRIRACLQRKLAKFNDKNSCLAILTDSKLLVEFPILSVNSGNAIELGALLEELGLPLKYKGDLRRRLAYLCKVEKCARPKSISEAYDSLGDEEVAPVVIEMDGENYPILYTVIEALTASNLREERNMGDTKLDETIQTTEEQAPATTESLDITSEAGNPATIEEARAEELTALLVQERAVAKGYRAETAAVLAIVMRKPIARGKEFSVLANELAARSSESLNDMVKDYLLELEGAPATEAVTPVENPTITFAEDSGNVLGNSLVSQIEVSDGTDDDDPAKSLEFLKKYSKV